MAAVLGLDDDVVEKICAETKGIVVAANYNCPGQLVISGEIDAINAACEALKEAGARRALILPVGGAFHSPLMEPAREELAAAIENTVPQFKACLLRTSANVRILFCYQPRQVPERKRTVCLHFGRRGGCELSL